MLKKVKFLVTFKMEGLKNYLESSTVHGLAYIGQTRNFAKVFWILIVITGFTVAGILIHQSFDNWQESPVKTTEETLPISEVTFPKITVCPPENKLTNLNYDIIMADNISVDLRNHIFDIQDNFTEKLLEFDYEMTVEDIGKTSFFEEKGFRNWYLGTR